jgi:hypothetical protein
MMEKTLWLGTRKGLIAVHRKPSGWEIGGISFRGIPVPMLLPDRRDGRLHAAVEHGHFGTKMQVSCDGGATWEEEACPAYPPKPDGIPDTICPMSQQVVPWSLRKIWALESGGRDEPGVLWCGTIPGGLFRSEDGGASWSLVEGLWNRPERAGWFGGGADWPGLHSILVDPRNSRRVLVAISCGGVWETVDGGENWELLGEGLIADFMPPESVGDPNIQDVHRLDWCRDDPDQVWAQHHCGIFRSRDGARTFERIEKADPSDFGFAVAVHPSRPGTAWFVPAEIDDLRVPVGDAVCAMRTTDDGASFNALRNGLPQEHAYHLVYRHSLAVSDDGSTLAFGSTTGSVWISEDGGDTWSRLSAELPPVYCVRFG